MQLVAKIFPKMQGGYDMEIKREYYLDKLIKRKNNGLIKVITGIRRCGKSYLLNTIFYNHLLLILLILFLLQNDCKNQQIPLHQHQY